MTGVGEAAAILAGTALLFDISIEHEIAPLLATSLVWFAERLPRGIDEMPSELDVLPPDVPGSLRETTHNLLAACARDRGIGPDSYLGWLESMGLRDPRIFFPRVASWLRQQVPPTAWLFDANEVERLAGAHLD